MKELHIDVPGNVSLAEPGPTSPLHIVDSHAEVMRIFPIYQSLSKEAKQRVLDNVKKWIKSEERDCDTCANDGECYVTMLKCKGYVRAAQ